MHQSNYKYIFRIFFIVLIISNVTTKNIFSQQHQDNTYLQLLEWDNDNYSSCIDIAKDTMVSLNNERLLCVIADSIDTELKNKLYCLVLVCKTSSDSLKVDALWELMQDYDEKNKHTDFVMLLDTLERYQSYPSLLESAMLFARANMLYKQGYYKEANELVSYGKNIYVDNHCLYNSWYVNALDIASSIKLNIPIYEEAIAISDTTISICKSENIHSLALGYAYLNLALAYQNLNQQKDIFYNITKSIEVFEQLKAWKPIAIAKNTLALYYNNIDSIAIATEYFQETLKYLELAGDTLSSTYLMAKSNFAMQFIGQDTAIVLYHELEYLAYNLIGENHPWYGIILHNLGSAYRERGDYENAEFYYNKTKNIRSNTLSEIHPHNLLLNTCCIGLYYKTKQWRKMIHQFDIDYAIRERFIRENFMVLSEKQRAELWADHQGVYQYDYPNVLTALPNTLKDIGAKRLYNLCLLTKGFLLGNSTQIKYAIANSNDSLLQETWQEYIRIKNEITALENETKEQQIISNIDSLHDYAKKIEIYFYKETKAVQSVVQYWSVTIDSICKHLNENEVAIEFVIVPKEDETSITNEILHYYALLLQKHSTSPKLIYIGTEEDILNDATLSIDSYNTQGEHLSIIWNKILAESVADINTIYISPAGVLHELPIESFPISYGIPMQCQYDIIRLSSTRQIALKNITSIQNAAIYGGINYDEKLSIFNDNSQPITMIDTTMRRTVFEIDSIYRNGVQYLKGAEVEATNINKILQSENINSILWTGTDATEHSFKTLSGQNYDLIHTATHGFFTRHHDNTFEDPLSHCGLLFAGANKTLEEGQFLSNMNDYDGVVTAQEVSLLDLNRTSLVVLSACETGKGEITGEGVFGLQRGFKMAGVQTIIMSLWKVNDQATQLLMTEFYNNWIGKHQSKREAFRNAQNTVRTQYEEPEYWAGFIMLD